MLTPEAIQLLAHSLERGVGDIPFVISPHQLVAVNILMEKFTTQREQRIALLNRLLGLQVSSSKHLTHGQAAALLQCAYPKPCSISEQEVNPDFAALVSDLNMEKIR